MGMSWLRVSFFSVLVLTACSREENTLPVPPVPPHAVVGTVTAQPCIYKDGDNKFAAVCGALYVPENRGKPSPRLIALPYQRVLATTKTPAEPVFGLTGGPGQSNARFGIPVDWFLAERDIVILGYRGVDGTARLDCEEVDSVIRSAATFSDSEGLKALGEAWQQCAVRLGGEGVDLGGYTMLEVADDIEALRQALGYGRIDIKAVSYGTRVALIYGWRYPDHLFRAALIGPNPPGHFQWNAAIIDRQLRRFAQLCAVDAYCASRTKDLAGDMKRALERMPKRWWGVPIHRDRILLSTFFMLWSTDNARSTFKMWIAAGNGHYGRMALMSAIYPWVSSHLVWGDYAAKAVSADFDLKTVCSPDLAPGRTLIGSPLDVMPCAAMGKWPEHKIPAEYRTVQPSTIETLMLSGSLDLAVPAEHAKNELLPAMPNARQVVVTEFGHFNLQWGEPEATRRLLTTFYRTGQVDSSLFTYRPVKFGP
jgi:pimeloyl-ACP methyl ester carboxylesterase